MLFPSFTQLRQYLSELMTVHVPSIIGKICVDHTPRLIRRLIERFFARILSVIGKVHEAINEAGAASVPHGPLKTATDSTIR